MDQHIWSYFKANVGLGSLYVKKHDSSAYVCGSYDK